MICELCHHTYDTVSSPKLRSKTQHYDQVCRNCVLSANNSEELLKLEEARMEYLRRVIIYHAACHNKGNFVPFYHDIHHVNAYGDTLDFTFK